MTHRTNELVRRARYALFDPLAHILALIAIGCVVTSPLQMLTVVAGLALAFMSGFWSATMIDDARIGRILLEHRKERLALTQARVQIVKEDSDARQD